MTGRYGLTVTEATKSMRSKERFSELLLKLSMVLPPCQTTRSPTATRLCGAASYFFCPPLSTSM